MKKYLYSVGVTVGICLIINPAVTMAVVTILIFGVLALAPPLLR